MTASFLLNSRLKTWPPRPQVPRWPHSWWPHPAAPPLAHVREQPAFSPLWLLGHSFPAAFSLGQVNAPRQMAFSSSRRFSSTAGSGEAASSYLSKPVKYTALAGREFRTVRKPEQDPASSLVTLQEAPRSHPGTRPLPPASHRTHVSFGDVPKGKAAPGGETRTETQHRTSQVAS